MRFQFSVRLGRLASAAAALAFLLAAGGAQAAAPAADCGAPPDAAAADATLLGWATEQAGLRVRPASVDSTWAIQPPPRDLAAELAAARAQGQVDAWLASLAPAHAEARRLEVEACRYRRIVEAGGWPTLPAGGPLREGDTGPGVAALRLRLLAEGYSPPAVAAAPETFDAGLADLLRAFQRRHDLEEDGVLGPGTRRALDVPADRRLAQIEANLERWRWLPRMLPPTRIEVDAGAAEVTLFEAGAVKLPMRAIVGDPKHRTPMFVSAVDSVLFNPPWNVPDSIARAEILPKAARDPGYLARMHIARTPNGLQQRPGPGNALGVVKFDFASPFGVYLHDTSSRGLFVRRVRTLSHGCIRLEKPRELAVEVLGAQGWSEAQVQAAIAAGTTRRGALQTTIPVMVVYRTASVDADGWAVLRADPYGWDAKLLAALAGR